MERCQNCIHVEACAAWIGRGKFSDYSLEDCPHYAFTNVFTLEETARYLRVSNQTVYNMIRDGRIKAYKVGREWRFLKADIIAYMDATSNAERRTE